MYFRVVAEMGRWMVDVAQEERMSRRRPIHRCIYFVLLTSNL